MVCTCMARVSPHGWVCTWLGVHMARVSPHGWVCTWLGVHMARVSPHGWVCRCVHGWVCTWLGVASVSPVCMRTHMAGCAHGWVCTWLGVHMAGCAHGWVCTWLGTCSTCMARVSTMCTWLHVLPASTTHFQQRSTLVVPVCFVPHTCSVSQNRSPLPEEHKNRHSCQHF